MTCHNPARIQKLCLLTLVLLGLTALCLAGCGPSWEATVLGPDGSPVLVDRAVLKSLAEFAEEGLEEDQEGVPLERVLHLSGHRVIDTLTLVDPEGESLAFSWAAIASSARWMADGQVSIGGEAYPVSTLEGVPPPLLGRVQVQITDIAPTVTAALGLPAPAQATGQALDTPVTEHVLLLFLDGFGYIRYEESLGDALIPNLAELPEPVVGLTVYPPCTSVASAALLTGAPPKVSGVDRRGIRKTETETLFDVAAAAGLRVEAVEGEALAFNLRNAEMHLSGDRDGNGSTDDNVLANALSVLDEGMPDLLFVHFHGIDDAGHTYGPGAPEEEATIREVDAAVGRLLEALPDKTLIIIFADHGMHQVEEEGRLGNHGNLIERDMFIPIIVQLK